MRLKHQIAKYRQAIITVFGIEKETKAGKARLEEPIIARPGTLQTAMQALLTRGIRHRRRAGAKRNTCGLPTGYGVHHRDAALKLEASAKRGDCKAGETRLQEADNFLRADKQSKSLRAKAQRPSKIARRITRNRQSCKASDITARVQFSLRKNKELGRVPYCKPQLSL